MVHVITMYVHGWVLLFSCASACEYVHACQYVLRGASVLGNEHLYISVSLNACMSVNFIFV